MGRGKGLLVLLVWGGMNTGCFSLEEDRPDAGYGEPSRDAGMDGGEPVGEVPAGPCIPEHVADCGCGLGKTGRTVCNAEGTAYGACSCDQAGTCTTSSLLPQGSIETGQTAIPYDRGTVTVKASHKVDADIIEDGCVSALELTVKAPGGACALTLSFKGFNSSGFGGISAVSLVADSSCPGFPDDIEGTYTADPGYGPWSYEGLQTVPLRMASSVCAKGVTMGFPDKPLRLFRQSPTFRELSVNLKGLALSGNLFSEGSASARCFDATVCGGTARNGGDGWCVAEDTCSTGYHESGDVCVPKATCAPGWTLYTDGTCRPWQPTTPLPGPLYAFASVAAQGHLYLVGGKRDDGLATPFSTEVLRAAIGAGGKLGEWVATTPLPEQRGGHTAFLHDGRLYVVGGQSRACANNSCTVTEETEVFMAPLQPDGTLGSWTLAGNLPRVLTGAATVVHNGFLYVLGKSTSGSVSYAPLQADGTVGAWRSGPSVGSWEYRGTAAAAGSFLYVVGTASAGSVTVRMARLGADGAVGSWTDSTQLEQPCRGHTVTVRDGFLHAFGGDCGFANQTPDYELLQSAPLSLSGPPGSWRSRRSLTPGRVEHRMAVHDRHVYLLGGFNALGEVLDDVLVAKFTDTGEGLTVP
jgi:N-acetylneuraminic acid mutarotase